MLLRKKFFYVLVSVCLSLLTLTQDSLYAQSYDTLRMMSYNLMYYRETTSFCTNTNNNPNAKDGYMEDIMDYVNPDLLVVCEMSATQTIAPFNLLNNAINKNGRNFWFANSSANSFQSIGNMLYFNQDKLELVSQYAITHDLSNQQLVRNIDVYRLYYKDSTLASHNDTTFINVVAAHLKAGSNSADELERADATEAVMAHLDSINASGNYFFAGDLNLYDSFEPAYQDLVNYVNPAQRFYDPVNIAGNWSNGPYAILHTQSTHTSGGCFAGGGMDNRFDFILASDEVMNNTDKVEYLSNTYNTVGQDGQRYNSSLISPTNNSAPTNVINALYGMSDHLPVTLDIKVEIPVVTSLTKNERKTDYWYNNPVNEVLKINFAEDYFKISDIQLYNASGQQMLALNQLNSQEVRIQMESFPLGVYFLYIRHADGKQWVEKLIKN